MKKYFHKKYNSQQLAINIKSKRMNNDFESMAHTYQKLG